MRKLLLLATIGLMHCSLLVKAEANTFVSQQIEQINKVLAEKSTAPNDPKAAFYANEKDKVLTLTFERNKSLAGLDGWNFELTAATLPNILLSTVYIKSKGIINGAVIGSKLIYQFQKEDYIVKVVIKGIDKQFEFQYPSSVLTLSNERD